MNNKAKAAKWLEDESNLLTTIEGKVVPHHIVEFCDGVVYVVAANQSRKIFQ